VRSLGDDSGAESTHADTLSAWRLRDGELKPVFDRQYIVWPRWGALSGALVWWPRGFFRIP
jgi:hypothetical protein